VLNEFLLDKVKKNSVINKAGIQKISELFLVNDKTLELKKKFASLNPMQRFDSYSKDNHRRGTRSFV